jgi:hypothetical protein
VRRLSRRRHSVSPGVVSQAPFPFGGPPATAFGVPGSVAHRHRRPASRRSTERPPFFPVKKPAAFTLTAYIKILAKSKI